MPELNKTVKHIGKIMNIQGVLNDGLLYLLSLPQLTTLAWIVSVQTGQID